MSTDVKLYVARHGIGTGNEPDAPLSSDGFNQAEQLAGFLSQMEDLHVDRLISSPYTRAWQTAEIIEERLKIKLGPPGNRLREQGVRGVTEEESDEMVIARVTSLTEELLKSDQHTFLLVTHRLILTLLLHHYAPDFVLEEITNPDLYLLTFRDGKCQVKRLWNTMQPVAV
ncbi:histidine phosphatase family protein [Paenibacillus polymyxa]|uniref:histidine phosphatase family protein n=1 Tax=Paenibacillus polymyxa TaxID=1406 RepID=UPI0008AF24DD|nr:histidine phosphatase family protein [Paenibacillus polymyxa]SEK05789.1 2,3-bisphosphoglycerate-dependent phosphoglycerate mutase [Paenibacillus polymyxa]